MNVEYLKKRNGVFIPEGLSPKKTFERLYLLVRQKEQRVYSNDEILQLPDIVASHKHNYEWSVRKESCKRFITYLKKKNKVLNILDIGCGNGWLSHKLAEIPQTSVIGLDINFTDLQQAANLFTNSNLQFVYGDIEKNILQNIHFDIIVFAGSIQYFSSLNEIINIVLKNLAPTGEIHIFDSFFYNKNNVEAAKKRCREYYEKMGCPEMANYFFHHLQNDIYSFNCTTVQKQNSLLKKIFFKKNTFSWLYIKHF